MKANAQVVGKCADVCPVDVIQHISTMGLAPVKRPTVILRRRCQSICHRKTGHRSLPRRAAPQNQRAQGILPDQAEALRRCILAIRREHPFPQFVDGMYPDVKNNAVAPFTMSRSVS